ncbi:MAG: hypothetical protein WCK00_12010 [Deltaproteobacteria bacterium]
MAKGTVIQKILDTHHLSGGRNPGQPVSIRIDQTLTQDATITIQRGASAAHEARQAVTLLATAAQDSGGAAQGIATAIGQQSAAIAQIASQIESLKIANETSAGAAEEISATMHALADTAANTQTQLSRFKLDP